MADEACDKTSKTHVSQHRNDPVSATLSNLPAVCPEIGRDTSEVNVPCSEDWRVKLDSIAHLVENALVPDGGWKRPAAVLSWPGDEGAKERMSAQSASRQK